MAMPAKTRNRFDNDPGKFLAYVDHCMETGDLDPLRDMGLAIAKTPESPEPPKPEVTPPEPPKAPKEAST